MAQKTVLSLLALPTGPPRTFAAKAPEVPAGAFSGTLSAAPAFVCALATTLAFGGTLITTPAFTAELRVVNVSS